MVQRILLSCLVILGVVCAAVEDGPAQSVFRVGAFCLQQAPPQPQAIHQLPSGEWRVQGNERDKLLNLGLNYFIACTGLFGEQAMVFMGDSLATAPAPKEFETTVEWSPANASSTVPYQVWKAIYESGGPGDPTW